MSALQRRLDRPPPLFIYRAVNAIRRFLSGLVRRLVPPRVALFEQFTGVWQTQMIYVAARLEIADALAQGPRTIEELAAASGAHPDALARLLRALVSVGIFERRSDGRFALNAVAETLRRDHVGSMRDIVLFLGSPHSMLGWTRFLEAVRTGKNAFQIANGKAVFDYLAERPEDEATFSGGMVSMTELDAPALVRGLDYSRFSTLCDVGGGHGVLLAAILSMNPKLRGVLFDMAHVLPRSGPVLHAWGVTDRCTTASGSFFDSVPPDCDAYVLKEILHDWDDQRARAILSVCRRAMRPGGTLLVMEMLLSDDNRPHPAKLLDMEMLDITYEGRQRSVDDFKRLFEACGFRLERVLSLPSPTSIIEAAAV